MNPKISIIIPCYNHGKYIEDAVKSVLSQTLDDFEIIIVDDGSTDEKTLNTLDKIKNEHPQIQIIHQKNGHLSNARNNGIKASQGEFFLPLDSDDVIESTMLEKCYGELSKNPALGFVYTYVRFFGEINFVWKNQEYNFYDLLFYNHPTVCGLIRKKAWEEVGGYDENMKNGYEDWDFWISLGERGWFGKLIKDPLFKYRKHGKSMVNDSRLKHDEIMKYIKSKHTILYNEKNLKKIKLHWKSENIFRRVYKKVLREVLNMKLKFALAGVLDKNEWKSHPITTLGHCIPIRLKKGFNILFKKEIFDTSYFGKNL